MGFLVRGSSVLSGISEENLEIVRKLEGILCKGISSFGLGWSKNIRLHNWFPCCMKSDWAQEYLEEVLEKIPTCIVNEAC